MLWYALLIRDEYIKSEKLARVLLKLKKYDELKLLYVDNIKKNIRDTIEI